MRRVRLIDPEGLPPSARAALDLLSLPEQYEVRRLYAVFMTLYRSEPFASEDDNDLKSLAIEFVRRLSNNEQ